MGDFELEAILRVDISEVSERSIPLSDGIVGCEGSVGVASELETIETERLLKPDRCGLVGPEAGDVGVCGDPAVGNAAVLELGVGARLDCRVGVLLIWSGLVVGKTMGKLLSMTLGVRARRGKGGTWDISLITEGNLGLFDNVHHGLNTTWTTKLRFLSHRTWTTLPPFSRATHLNLSH